MWWHFLLSIVLFVFALYTIRSSRRGAPCLPMTNTSVKRLISAAAIQPGEKVYDLGSGDGRVVFAAANQGAQAIGVELHPVLYWYSLVKRSFSSNKERITFIHDDLWQVSVADADVVIIFFIKDKMPLLKQKLQQEMKPGSRIISHIFTFPDWQYQKKDATIYTYTID